MSMSFIYCFLKPYSSLPIQLGREEYMFHNLKQQPCIHRGLKGEQQSVLGVCSPICLYICVHVCDL
jgi:hypothetical protein